ncbi:hypothetical protein D3C81_2110300 [compost metagenome]
MAVANDGGDGGGNGAGDGWGNGSGHAAFRRGDSLKGYASCHLAQIPVVPHGFLGHTVAALETSASDQNIEAAPWTRRTGSYVISCGSRN